MKKNIFFRILDWFKLFFSFRKKTTNNDIIIINEEIIEPKKSHEQLIFEKLKENGFFKKEAKLTRDEINDELSESARKRNEFMDEYNSTGGINRLSDELLAKLDGERAKDRTTLIRQGMLNNTKFRKKTKTIDDSIIENINTLYINRDTIENKNEEDNK